MATRGMNTMVEGLQKLMQDITALKATPDADVAFLIGLETNILQKLRENFDNAAGQMAPPPGNATQMGGAEMGAGAGLEGLGASLMAQGAGAMGGMGGGGVAAGMPGPGGPTPPPMPGVRFTPDAMRQAMRPGVQGG